MKKVLIIEDNQIVANIYRNKLAAEGYQTEIAPDGESGLDRMRTLQPDLMILDLMLPKMSGVEVIKQARNEAAFAKLPIIVLSNTYLTNLIQEAWRAGANKCLSKASCSPKEFLDIVRSVIGHGSPMPQSLKALAPKAEPAKPESSADTSTQAELRQQAIESLSATFGALPAKFQSLVEAKDEVEQLKLIYELYRLLHTLTGNAGIAGLNLIAQLSNAVEALLKELYEKPKSINPSTLRTVAAGGGFLGFLFEHVAADQKEMPAADVLVVDDEPISRRAIIYALEKARLRPSIAEDADTALQLVGEKNFDLIFLDVDMPGMNGYELCAKLRTLPQCKTTPVVFVTALSSFDSRNNSMMSGGNDFIAKPFLFIELTVKALIHVLRAKLGP
jgi:DNA-binding response OmpR family regulator